MPGKRIPCLLFACIILQTALTRPAAAQKTVTPEIRAALADSLENWFLEPRPQVIFNISRFDLVPFASQPDAAKFDTAFLQKTLKELSRDSLNPFARYNLANYYKRNGSAAESRLQFQKALSLVTPQYFKKDSARCYSLRGMIRMDLGEDAAPDFKQALKINPADSIAIVVYPMLLGYSGAFDEADGYLTAALDQKEKRNDRDIRENVFVILVLNEFARTMAKLPEDTDSLRLLCAPAPIRSLFNFSRIDRYAGQLGHYPTIRTLLGMAELYCLSSKLVYVFDAQKRAYGYASEDRKKLAELEQTFSDSSLVINPYGRARCLGFVKLLQGDLDAADVWFEKAITAFPVSKAGDLNRPDENYDNLYFTQYMRRDYRKGETVQRRKLATGAGTLPDAVDYLRMARLALLNNQKEEAKTWLEKAKAMDPENFDVLVLKAHLYFLDDIKSLSMRYLSDAFNHARSAEDVVQVFIQTSVYQTVWGERTQALGNLQYGRMNSSSPCEKCDWLEKEYLTP